MNILLIDKFSSGQIEVTGTQFHHIKNVLKANIGDTVFSGEINGKMGRLEITSLTDSKAVLAGELNQEPPKPLPVKLLLAVSRPKMLKRILRSVSMLGVKEIYLMNSYKVEKSFWKSDLFENNKYQNYLREGLSQCKDTVMPNVYLKKLFKPFVEDELPDIIQGTQGIVAHPGDFPKFPQGINKPLTLAIGPEGGFTDYEVMKLNEVGLATHVIGQRILRMEDAVVSILSQHADFYL